MGSPTDQTLDPPLLFPYHMDSAETRGERRLVPFPADDQTKPAALFSAQNRESQAAQHRNTAQGVGGIQGVVLGVPCGAIVSWTNSRISKCQIATTNASYGKSGEIAVPPLDSPQMLFERRMRIDCYSRDNDLSFPGHRLDLIDPQSTELVARADRDKCRYHSATCHAEPQNRRDSATACDPCTSLCGGGPPLHIRLDRPPLHVWLDGPPLCDRTWPLRLWWEGPSCMSSGQNTDADHPRPPCTPGQMDLTLSA